MAREGGLFIDITGEVSTRLLMGMERLKQRMNRLSAAAMRLSTTAKTMGNVQLGRGFDMIAREAQGAADDIDGAVDSMGNKIQEFYDEAGDAAHRGAGAIVDANGKVISSSKKAAKTQSDQAEHLKAFYRVQDNIADRLRGSKEGFTEIDARARDLTRQITRLHRSMGETGAIGKGQASLEEYADNLDVVRLAELEVQKRLKKTANGFRAVDAEAREALDLDPDQYDKLTQVFSRTDDRILNLRRSMKQLASDFGDADQLDLAGFRVLESRLRSVRSEFNKLGPEIRETYGEAEFENLQRNLYQMEEDFKQHNADIKEATRNTRKWADAKRKIRDLEGVEFEGMSTRRLSRYRSKVTSLGNVLEGFKNTIPHEEFVEMNDILDRSSARLEAISGKAKKSTAPVDDLRKKLESLEGEMPEFEAYPIKQLQRVKAETTAWHTELRKLKGTMDDATWRNYMERMSRVDNRLTKLTGSSSKYGQQARDTRTILQRLGQAFDQFSHKLLRQIHLWGLIGIVTVGAQAAYAALAVWAMKAAGSLSETADKLNMNVQSMQELQAAAVTTGTSTKDLREALESLNTTVIDAIEGKSKAKDAFDELGIEFETLVKRGNDTEEMFDLVMGKLDEVDSSAKRLSLAKDIFGEGPASTLINLVGNLEDARKAMKQFGITMSDEAAQDASNFWNKIRGLWLVIKRQFISASLEAIDVVDRFADQLLKAAKQGNIFEGTIVPAIKSTIGIFKSLYQAGRGLYWLLHRMYELWDILLVPIKALMGVGVVKFFNYLTKGIQNYIASIRTATTLTGRFQAALMGLLRFTGFYLIVESIIRLINWIGKAQEVAKETELTFSEAFRAIAEESINTTLKAFAKAIPEIAEVLAKGGVAIGKKFFWGFLKGALPDPGQISLIKTIAKRWMGIFNDEINKENEENQLKLGLNLADEESKKALERFRNKAEEGLGDLEGLFEGSTSGAQKSREEMLKTAEVVDEASGDISDSVEKMAKEGRVEDVEKFLPFARDEVKQKIEDTKEQIKVFEEEIQRIQRLPGPYGEVDDELLQKYQQLQVALKDLRDQYQNLQTDIPLKAQMNKFEENLSNSMERAKLKFEEGSMDLLQAQEQVQQDRVKHYQDLLKEATTGEDQASDQLIRKIKNKLLKAQNELSDIESDQLEYRHDVIQKGAERNIETVENELKQREQLLKEQVAKGERHEAEAALERAKAQEQASKEILEIRKNEVEKTKDLLGENLKTVKLVYGANSDEVEWFKETVQAKEEADQNHTENRIQRLNQVRDTIEQVFQREKKLADQRKATATAGQMEEQTRYTGSGAREIGQEEVQNLQEQYDAAKQNHERVKQLYDDRLQAAKEAGLEETQYFKELQLEKEKYQKKTNAELIKLQDKLRREQIREQGSVWEKMKLGMNNAREDVEDQLIDIADMSKSVAQTMSDELGGALNDFVMGTKSASEAWKSFTSSMFEQITEMMTNYLTQRFMTMILGQFGPSQSGGGMTGPPQAGKGTQATGFISSIMGAISMFHSGGKVGTKNTATRTIDPSAMADMMVPRLHDGLKPDEYPAVLQKGEEVKSKDQVADEEKRQPSIQQNISVKTGPDGKIAQESMQQMQRKAARSLNNAMRRS